MMTAPVASDPLFALATLALIQSSPPKSSYNTLTELSDDDEEESDHESIDVSTEASCTDETCCPALCPPSSSSPTSALAFAPTTASADPPTPPTPAQPHLPPEILLQILSHALSTSLQTACILDNQFGHLTTYCRPCAYRSLSLVDRIFHAVAKEVFLGEIVLDRREAQTRDDSGLVERVVREQGWGGRVKHIDASLRGSNSGVPLKVREADAGETVVEAGEGERERQSDR